MVGAYTLSLRYDGGRISLGAADLIRLSWLQYPNVKNKLIKAWQNPIENWHMVFSNAFSWTSICLCLLELSVFLWWSPNDDTSALVRGNAMVPNNKRQAIARINLDPVTFLTYVSSWAYKLMKQHPTWQMSVRKTTTVMDMWHLSLLMNYMPFMATIQKWQPLTYEGQENF